MVDGGVNSLRVLGQVAQLVEQRTENPRVGGSIPSLAICTESLVALGDFAHRALSYDSALCAFQLQRDAEQVGSTRPCNRSGRTVAVVDTKRVHMDDMCAFPLGSNSRRGCDDCWSWHLPDVLRSTNRRYRRGHISELLTRELSSHDPPDLDVVRILLCLDRQIPVAN